MKVTLSSALLCLALCLSAAAGVSASPSASASTTTSSPPLSLPASADAAAVELHSRSRMLGTVFDKIKLNKAKLESKELKSKQPKSKKKFAYSFKRPRAGYLPVFPASSERLKPRGGPFPMSSPYYWQGRPSMSSTFSTLSSKLTTKINAARPRPGSSVPGAGGFSPTFSRYGAHSLGSKIKGVGRGAKRGARKIKGFKPLGGSRRLRGYGYI
ncbi:hypothetical protein BCV69DRAFT_638 [Microstroma glucosiphilum]|uniref:Uncharacterized protein n=1 Tax=Pseudomicrostroma glucosiphilum TaxID=1684307 RepID=A0A316UDZ7_9BASI|nr:hypothetical protein BCV69DRAFT_638 [Pseudomicrostroma glucosiphilum]PWN23487.1 hypothetical protein BCV69DRAFT_638 [Pseudomicrostroma glucosiphilum]